MSAQTLRTGLDLIMKRIPKAGSFAISKALENAPSPGLFIKGIGNIGLPLSDRDAEAIVAVC
jgi:hypothetical protein